MRAATVCKHLYYVSAVYSYDGVVVHSHAISSHSVPIERLIAMIKCVGLASSNKTIWLAL